MLLVVMLGVSIRPIMQCPHTEYCYAECSDATVNNTTKPWILCAQSFDIYTDADNRSGKVIISSGFLLTEDGS